ncbi:protein transport protein Sec24A [Sesamum alatum]|uniref:Protein transport protein Sec24A n=1 Tax=Sesamum alatum TaxID=300844 RepID=A0AAE1Z2Z2_9LAMI|nr:protein transport protein Sec24A [Sesamum alatum]
MAVRPTMARFPADPREQEACGVPWGLTLAPFAAKDENGIPPVYGSGGELLPRCENCWAYYNTYCEQDQWSWDCALCGTTNGLSSESIARYSLPESCPENMSSFIDLELPLEESEEMQARPVYVAAVDLSSSEEFLELTKSALLAALEAIGPGSLFGLATFSHKIGLYDVQGPIPVVKNVFIPPDSVGNLTMELEDVMPLFSFLAPVDTCKDRIASALETLKPTTSWERTTAAGQGVDGVLLGGRGFGVAMEALLRYLGSEYGNTYALARVFAFLSGPPDYGLGQLDTRRYGEQYASKGEDADRALLPEQTPFYKDLAAVAVQAGICVDLFAVTNEYTDLASLKFLSIESGGSLFLYSSTDDSTLPQDMYRMLSRPYAFNCVLRVRTSSEFKLGHSYGHFFPDPEYENVQHIICCDSFATYAYDFDFANEVGFSRHSKELPTLQIAFQYTVVVPPDEPSISGSSSSKRTKYSLKRRLRIRTLQFGTAFNINEIYDSVDPEVVLSILVHEVILSSLEHGVREGRILLHEWLLQPLPRLVFALLRNPLLRFHEEGVHPDYRIYLQCLFSVLEPSSLNRAVYPLLASYDTPDKQAFPRHSLSRAALYNKAGHDDATPFENYLIEEQDVGGSGFTSVMGFVSFLDEENLCVSMATRIAARYVVSAGCQAVANPQKKKLVLLRQYSFCLAAFGLQKDLNKRSWRSLLEGPKNQMKLPQQAQEAQGRELMLKPSGQTSSTPKRQTDKFEHYAVCSWYLLLLLLPRMVSVRSSKKT